MDAYIALEDGRVIEARGRAAGQTHGELVFTTAYTGYEESLTDPSYEEQVLTFSYPLIGNYGVREERFESDRIHPRAAVAHEFTEDIIEWFDRENVPAIDHIDTRELVTSIRKQGAMQCGIVAGPNVTPTEAEAELSQCQSMSDHVDIGKRVTTVEHTTHGAGDIDVALIDCGAKMSIVDSLVERGATVNVLPFDTTPHIISSMDPDIVFISNGPGDPANFEAAEALVAELNGQIPIAGICLGQQVIARALGGTTEKMDFGHRGINQPVRDLDSGKVVMTTQNHGYTVDEPGDTLSVRQVNVNDGTAEGLVNEELDIITRQYHPEAHPGPHDSLGFFDEVLSMTEHDVLKPSMTTDQ